MPKVSTSPHGKVVSHMNSPPERSHGFEYSSGRLQVSNAGVANALLQLVGDLFCANVPATGNGSIVCRRCGCSKSRHDASDS